MFIILQGFL
jgi:hypothetical protein